MDADGDRVGRPALVVGAAAASALLLWSASPAVGVGWVAWVALVPVAAVAARAPGRLGRLAVPLGYGLYLELLLVPALPFGLARDQWADEPVVPVLVADSPVVAAALVGVPLATLILYVLRFPQPLPRRLVSRGGPAALIAVPAIVWTGLDVVRVKFDPSGFWGPLFLSQHDLPTAALAALAGPWLLTALVVAVNYALALALVSAPRALSGAAGTLGLVAAVAAAALFLGGSAPGASVVLAAVQPGYDTSEFDLPVLRHFRRESRDYEKAALDVIRDLEPLTREAARRGAELVVWPEAALWVDPRVSASVGRALRRLTRVADTTVVVPYFVRSRAQSAVVAVRPDGTLTDARAKRRPMWFVGEDGGNRRPPRPLATEAGSVATLLGVDNQDPAVPRTLAGRGAAVVAASTHDWRQLAPYQRAFSQLHSASLGLPLVRADWRFGSAIFGAGAVRADAGDGKRRAVVVASVASSRRATAYARLGDVGAWLAVAAAAGVVVAGAVLRASAAR